MARAWRACVEPIAASAGTVIIGLLCLLLSDLNSNRGLGPVGAIGIASAFIAALTLLPALLMAGPLAVLAADPASGVVAARDSPASRVEGAPRAEHDSSDHTPQHEAIGRTRPGRPDRQEGGSGRGCPSPCPPSAADLG